LWSVYIVRCKDGALYTGISNNVARRVAKHNAGRGSKGIRPRLPVRLVYSEPIGDRGAATRRERAIKRMPASAKRKLVWGRRRVGPARIPTQQDQRAKKQD